MNEKDLFQAIGKVDDCLIDRSEKRVSMRWVKWVALAAGLMLVSAIAIFISTKIRNPSIDSTIEALPPGIIVDGVEYYVSGWDISETDIPAGFSYGGVINSATADGKYLLGSEYYSNKDIPEWIYVFGKRWVIGPQDEIESMAYMRFVVADARFHTLLNYDGQLFECLWSFQSDDRDNIQLAEKYGLRIETLPESCVLVGTAFLEELDRIPQKEWGVNHMDYEGATVFIDENDDQVIYVSISWHTATDEEGKETLHNGYDVFIRRS